MSTQLSDRAVAVLELERHAQRVHVAAWNELLAIDIVAIVITEIYFVTPRVAVVYALSSIIALSRTCSRGTHAHAPASS